MFSSRPIENQSDGIDSGIISSIDLSPSSDQHFSAEEVAILMVTKVGLSETLMWCARAGQARRIASMLSLQDAELVEAYARECEECAHAASIEGTRINNRRSIETQYIHDQPLKSLARSRLPKQAA